MVLDQDALVRYRYVSGRDSTDAVTASSARDVIGEGTQVELWTKARQIQTKSRNSVDLPPSPRTNRRPSSAGPGGGGGERLSTTTDRMSLWNRVSPQIQRLPTTASPKLQRGKELQVMPLAPSPRARGMLHVVERRKSTSIADSSSMAKMRSYNSALVQADTKLPLQKEIVQRTKKLQNHLERYSS